MSYNFKFAGTALSDLFGVVSKTPLREVAVYDGTLQSVPGKSGDEFIDNKRYKNVPFSREIGFFERQSGIDDYVEKIINWLAYHPGYQEFEDTDHPGMVTEAVLTNFSEVQTKLRRLHTATLKFSRKPYWYLKSGLQPIELTSAQALTGITLANPYLADALPLVEIVVDGSVITSPNSFWLKITTSNGFSNTYPINSLYITAARTHAFFDTEKEQVRAQKADGTDIHFSAEKVIPPFPPDSSTLIKLDSMSPQNLVIKMIITPRWRCL